MFGNWASIAIPTRPGEVLGAGPPGVTKYTGPLTFPGYRATRPANASFDVPDDDPANSFYAYFAKIRRATDVTKTHLDVLNVSVEHDVDIADMLGAGGGGARAGVEAAAAAAGGEGKWEGEGKEGPAKWIPTDDDAVFSERKRELLIENRTAYEALSRTRRDIKLGHMYRFFQSVELVGGYYGTSEDAREAEEKKAKEEEEKAEEEAKKQAAAEIEMSSSSFGGDGGGRVDVVMMDDDDPCGSPCKRKADEQAQPAAVEKKGRPDDDNEDKPADKEDKDKPTDTKFSMPEKFREDLVKGFVEPLCWGYGVRIYAPRAPPKLGLQRSKFSVHLTDYVHLTPSLAAEARAGLVEGPVLATQVRHEHAFRSVADMRQLVARRLATMHKKPAPAPVTAERHRRTSSRSSRKSREEKEKEKEKEKQVDSSAELAEDAQDDLLDEGLLLAGPDGVAEDVVGVLREVVAMVSLAQERAREGVTERKQRFRAVGKDKDSYWDDIFLITSLHHHISISHVRVSTPYLRFLRTGKLPSPNHPFVKQPGWESLKVQKSRYWDLLEPMERVEAARALSAVLGWLTRYEIKRQ